MSIPKAVFPTQPQAIEQCCANIEAALNQDLGSPAREQANADFELFLRALETGNLRAAAPEIDETVGTAWQWAVNANVKRMILLGFRLGQLREERSGALQFCDKHNLWPNETDLAARRIRIVPGGSAVRRGAYLGSGVTLMPPAYVNIGAYVDDNTMIDSHALVGSCAQVGKRCHISAAAQIGGVLEPIGSLPVVIEDDCFVGGNCGIYEGCHLGPKVVLAAGVILTRSSRIYDLVEEREIVAKDGVLHVPANAVIVPGSRPIAKPYARELGLHVYAPMLIKYRDDKTDASTAIEAALR